ncbi:hypothetical protein [Sediminitomix flava]|uniref:Alginate export domain-containing protein n=1 Tax=Sediminitomix flava TaxID=379075 RepID=A0A315ZGV3_SEDFL|nr:hypothetical protein [Sediminitomix flava]PWJ44582.1 hypothetical protein BC781_101953 [Sediminitomix flava]
MTKKLYLIFIGLSILNITSVFAQEDDYADMYSFDEPKKLQFGGYLKYLQTVNISDLSNTPLPSGAMLEDGQWLTDNLIHNRMNLEWTISNQLTFTASARNRMFYGETINAFTPDLYERLYIPDQGLINMSWTWGKGDSYLINTTLDRLYLNWENGSTQVRVGRQRINWGIASAWNPNDIFNAYAYFDFDYEERAGTDAVLIRQYLGETSSIEFASSISDDFDEITMAGLFRFNKWEYDFQALAGKSFTDLVVGAGWSGEIKGASFKGEMTYFHPYKGDETPTFIAVLSADYTFPNTLNLMAESIFNTNPIDISGLEGLNGGFLIAPVTAKTLTYTHYSQLLGASMQVTPLFTSGVSGLINSDGSWYIGPQETISLTDNLELLLTAQLFGGPEGSVFAPSGEFGGLVFWRLKWSY